MPDPQAHPQLAAIKAVARNTLLAGVLIMAMKFGVYALTRSAAVLSDALESIINIAAAAMMAYSIHLANRPADREHPYGHGKIEFMAVGLEGWMILTAAVVIAYEAIKRFFWEVPLLNLTWGLASLGVIAGFTLALAIYVAMAGKRYQNATLKADARHLFTDAASTLAGIAALGLVKWTGETWIDPLAAMLMSALILWTSWRLLWQSIGGLLDAQDLRDDAEIRALLDTHVAAGAIRGYHKVRHRHSGAFHWVDLHLQVDAAMTVAQSHEIATKIEREIEAKLGQGDATAHVEPAQSATPA